MNDKAISGAKQLVASHMVDAGAEAVRSNQSLVVSLIAQRRIPEDPWPAPLIEQFMHQLATMDTNNFVGHAGGGEREGRVFSTLVARRHFYMTHGIGRSGDITADQPKAAGSSLLAKLANFMALDAMKSVGFTKLKSAIVVPLATGMSLSLVLQAARQARPAPAKARFVIWPRIDQKTSLKCITAAGMTPVVVPLRPVASSTPAIASSSHQDASTDGGEPPSTAAAATMLCIHPDDVAAAIDRIVAEDPDGADAIACVLSTTSCFAPRVPDDVLALARVCEPRGIPIVVNNAYGLQSRPIINRLDAALGMGTVWGVVQSTDKNFLTPVGGSVISGSNSKFMSSVAALYPGRASASPVVDFFLTMLEMGRRGWQALQADRVRLFPTFFARMQQFARERGERVICHERNDISVAMTLSNWSAARGAAASSTADTEKGPETLGAELFRHRVTGPKVIIAGPKTAKKLCGCTFSGYGTHSDDADTSPMIIVACAVGMTGGELNLLIERLAKAYPVVRAPTEAAASS